MPINTKKLGSSWFLVKADTPNSSGYLYPFQTLVEMCNGDSHLEMRGDELWYREQPIKKITGGTGQITVILPFDTYPTCTKCGEIHLFKKPIVKYIPENDILQKTCIVCGHSWFENIHPLNNRKGKK